MWKCLACHRDGRDTTVYGKLITKNDGLVQGLLKYVWSGCVIECPSHGEIYRSRKHWYGNNEPKDVTRIDTIHIWPGDDHSRLASDVTPRKFMELIVYASRFVENEQRLEERALLQLSLGTDENDYGDGRRSSGTVLLGAQQRRDGKNVFPFSARTSFSIPRHASCVNFISVWNILNTTVEVRDQTFLLPIDRRAEFSPACGHVFCDTCTTNRRIVPWIDTETPVRVCSNCYDYPASQAPTSIPQSSSPSSKKSYSGKSDENGSSGESASTVSSGEHLNDLCLSPTDIFDIEQPGAGECAWCVC